MLAKRYAVRVVDRVTVEASDIFVTVGHAIAWSQCCIEVGAYQAYVADSSIPG